MISFWKMHGLGNDFMVIETMTQSYTPNPIQINQWANRHTGVGFDQLLLITPAPDDKSDFGYQIFNADGSESGQCGNGARCIGKFIFDNRLSNKKTLTLATKTGHMQIHMSEHGDISAGLGIPKFDPQDIPLRSAKSHSPYTLNIDDEDISFNAVNVGNPHITITVDSIDDAPVEQLGPKLESHLQFPERTNVGFMQIIDPHHIQLRVYERGAGETLACGSGAAAAAVIGITNKQLKSPVTASLPGGNLLISWDNPNSPVWLSGPAISVFHGKISNQ